jgi:hypothetical protein
MLLIVRAKARPVRTATWVRHTWPTIAGGRRLRVGRPGRLERGYDGGRSNRLPQQTSPAENVLRPTLAFAFPDASITSIQKKTFHSTSLAVDDT